MSDEKDREIADLKKQLADCRAMVRGELPENPGNNAKFGLVKGGFWGPYPLIEKAGFKVFNTSYGYPDAAPVAIIDSVQAKDVESFLAQAQDDIKHVMHLHKDERNAKVLLQRQIAEKDAEIAELKSRLARERLMASLIIALHGKKARNKSGV